MEGTNKVKDVTNTIEPEPVVENFANVGNNVTIITNFVEAVSNKEVDENFPIRR